jgi:hypothetical protein
VVSPDGGQVIYSLFDAGYAHLHTIPRRAVRRAG